MGDRCDRCNLALFGLAGERRKYRRTRDGNEQTMDALLCKKHQEEAEAEGWREVRARPPSSGS